MPSDNSPDDKAADLLPPGDYAIVELFGHVTLVGRVTESERFGSKMLAIEALFRDELLPCVYYGGAAVYGLTPVSAAVAWARQPRSAYNLPVALRSTVPPLLLEASDHSRLDLSSRAAFDCSVDDGI